MDYVLIRNRNRYVVDQDAIDFKKYRGMLKIAPWRVRWDYNGWKKATTTPFTIRDWNQTLITKLNQISAQIHKSTNRGGANTIVIAPENLPLIESLEYYNIETKKIGNRYDVIINNWMPRHEVLI
jgi:hypothetical protein